MQTVIAYVDDAQQALRHLSGAREAAAVRWVLVGCPPRVTHHVSRWVTRSARESWRSKWADKLFAQLVPALERPGDEIVLYLGDHNLKAQAEALMREHQGARIVDARRPRNGPVDPAANPQRGLVSLLAAGLSPALWVALE
ncbi:MAG: hypothetical protein FJY42_12025 [Betaproteobacteria bacterium]|nr:hypothetical protein [Betaproteobacteria bacterium]